MLQQIMRLLMQSLCEICPMQVKKRYKVKGLVSCSIPLYTSSNCEN